jgi:phosphoribosylformylglycinamidine synthase PurS subunit
MTELHPLLTHKQIPVGAHLLHLHSAALPGAIVQAALQGNGIGLRQRQDRQQEPMPVPQAEGGQQGQQPHGGSVTQAGQGPDRHGFVQHSDHRVERPDAGWKSACQDLTNAPGSVPLFHARVHVSLRPSVLDPAGEATRAAAGRLGVEGVQRLRIGKAIEVDLEAPDQATARARLERLSDRLLANPVIEDWSLEMGDEV